MAWDPGVRSPCDYIRSSASIVVWIASSNPSRAVEVRGRRFLRDSHGATYPPDTSRRLWSRRGMPRSPMGSTPGCVCFGISSTSIRRWTSAGLPPSSRSMRGGTRRRCSRARGAQPSWRFRRAIPTPWICRTGSSSCLALEERPKFILRLVQDIPLARVEVFPGSVDIEVQH